jgi:hypothetical protein
VSKIAYLIGGAVVGSIGPLAICLVLAVGAGLISGPPTHFSWLNPHDMGWSLEQDFSKTTWLQMSLMLFTGEVAVK